MLFHPFFLQDSRLSAGLRRAVSNQSSNARTRPLDLDQGIGSVARKPPANDVPYGAVLIGTAAMLHSIPTLLTIAAIAVMAAPLICSDTILRPIRDEV
jgi:hypothetical protein